MQSESQHDSLQQSSEKQTTLDNGAITANNTPTTPSQPDTDGDQPFLDSQVPTLQVT
jgi:hypothetical protein